LVHPGFNVKARTRAAVIMDGSIAMPDTGHIRDHGVGGLQSRNKGSNDGNWTFQLPAKYWKISEGMGVQSPIYPSPISNRRIPHVPDFSTHCHAFAGGIGRYRYFSRTGSTARKKFMFPRVLRRDMPPARLGQKL
jgi:hypothetical protein